MTSLLDLSVFTYYRNLLLTHPKYLAYQEFMHTPIGDFECVKKFMDRASLLFDVLMAMCIEGSTEPFYNLVSLNTPTFSSPQTLLRTFFPSAQESILIAQYSGNVSMNSVKYFSLESGSVVTPTIRGVSTSTATNYPIVAVPSAALSG